MPLFWSVNKQIRTDTVFHVIICEKHGTSTRATAPRAAKIGPRREIFSPKKMTRCPRAPPRFLPVRCPRSAVLATLDVVRQRMGPVPTCCVFAFGPRSVVQRPAAYPVFAPAICPAAAGRSTRCVLAGRFGTGRGRRAAACFTGN